MDLQRIARHEKLVKVCEEFLREQRVTCAEATTDDHIYVNAPELVERIAEIIGYWRDPDADEDEEAER